jgi:hypothetical protein
MNDAPLTHHPETGEPLKRIILGGYGVMKPGTAPEPSGGGSCCGPSGCC